MVSTIALRRISLFLLLSSIILIFVAMIKESFVVIRLNGNSYRYGLFTLCYNDTCLFINNQYDARSARFHAFQVFVMSEMILRCVAFLMMVCRAQLETRIEQRYTNKLSLFRKGLIGLMITCAVLGAVAVGVTSSLPNAVGFRPYGSLGVSTILLIISYPLSVMGYSLYGAGWHRELTQTGDSANVLLENNANQPLIHQQQVAININGQVVMATITPAAPTAQQSNLNNQNNQSISQSINQQNQNIAYMPNPAAVLQSPSSYASYNPPQHNPTVIMNGQPISHLYPQTPQQHMYPYEQPPKQPYGEFVSSM